MQMDYIENLNKQLDKMEKAIARKDMQFDGAKGGVKDDLINGRL